MKKKLMLYLFGLIISLCTIISAAIFVYVQYQTRTLVERQKDETLVQVREMLSEYDRRLLGIEQEIDKQYLGILPQISRDIAGYGDAGKISVRQLREITSRYGVDEIYLINKDGIVFSTTYENDLGLNLRRISDELDRFIDNILGKGTIYTHRALISVNNHLNKYLYYSPEGSTQIVEISIDMKRYVSQRYSPDYLDFLLNRPLQAYIENNRYINDVDVFEITNREGWSVFLSGEKLGREELEAYEKGNGEYKQAKGRLTTYNSVIPFENESHLYFGRKLLVRLKYDFWELYRFARNVILFSLTAGILVSVAAFFASTMIFNRQITNRVLQINRNLNCVEEGVYTGDLTFPQNDELTEIARNINKMKTTIHEREEQLKGKVEELEQTTRALRYSEERSEYDRLRTEFFANMSHEFRTPLNMIFSTLQLLQLYETKSSLSSQGIQLGKYLKIIKQNSMRILRLSNNILDMTKVDTQFEGLELHNYDIARLVEDVVQSITEYAEQKSIQVVFLKNTQRQIMACDPDKIERILLNLVSNAFKYSSGDNRVEIRIDSNGEKFRLSVKDFGIGIPEDKQELIFQRFRQVDKSFTRNAEGSGIGLALVKSFVDMHRGSIWVKSRPGEGSEFTVELPVTVLDEPEQQCLEHHSEARVQRMHVEFSDIYR